MKRAIGFGWILLLAIVFCCSSIPAAHAQWTDPVSMAFALMGMPNAWVAVSKPIWQITQNGTAYSVHWTDHSANPRFAIYDPGNIKLTDDLVLDKETGLVWARNMNLHGALPWADAMGVAANTVLGKRNGWRAPTVSELQTLLDPEMTDPALPAGHPFINLPETSSGHREFWTSTPSWAGSGYIVCIDINDGTGGISFAPPEADQYVWLVRGGNGGGTQHW